MKKIFSFVAAALMSASMFAFDGPVPTDADLDYAAGQLCVAVYFQGEVCNDIVFIGSYNGWSEDVLTMTKFEPVDGFDGWYQVAVDDESESIEGKPVQLKKDGSFSWDYQTGDENSWELIRGTVNIEAGYAGESNLKGYDKTNPVVLVSAGWKAGKSPCTTVPSHKYKVVLDAPESENYAPAIIGDFNGWSEGVAMTLNMSTFTYEYEFTDEEGHGFKFKAVGDTDWSNQIQYYDEAESAWKDMANIVLPVCSQDTTLEYDFSDGAKYRYTKDAPAQEYKYTEYENWQIKYGNGDIWEWSDNMEKVEDGLFKLEIRWEGTGFNVKSDENPIKKDWFAPDDADVTIGEEVIAPVDVDVYLKVVDDETIKLGVGVEPVVALKHVKAVKASKAIMKNGQIIFQAGEKVYNVLGTEMK